MVLTATFAIILSVTLSATTLAQAADTSVSASVSSSASAKGSATANHAAKASGINKPSKTNTKPLIFGDIHQSYTNAQIQNQPKSFAARIAKNSTSNIKNGVRNATDPKGTGLAGASFSNKLANHAMADAVVTDDQSGSIDAATSTSKAMPIIKTIVNPDSSLNESEVIAFIDRSTELAKVRDIDGFAKLLSDDAKFITLVNMLGESYSSVYTKTQYIEETKQGLGMGSDYSYQVSIDEVILKNDTATVLSTVREKVDIAGMRFLSEAKETATIKRINGELKYTEINGQVTMSPLTTL